MLLHVWGAPVTLADMQPFQNWPSPLGFNGHPYNTGSSTSTHNYYSASIIDQTIPYKN